MKANWQTKKLGEVCDIEIGKTPSRSNKKFWDLEKQTENVWLSIRDLSDAEDKIISDSKEYISEKGAEISKKVKSGTLLVSFKLTLGRLAFAGRDLYTNEAIASLNIKNEKEICKEFLYQYLSYFDWDEATRGDVKVKGKTLNKAKLKKIEITTPPLSEQKRIVKILDEAFEKIEKAKENAERNLKNSKELFESYLKNVFANPEKDWKEKTLGEVVETTQGVQIVKSLQVKNPKIGYRRYLYISDFNHEKNLKYVQDIYPKKLVTPDDLIVVNTGASAGKIYRGINGILSNNLFKVSFLKDVLDTDFLYYFVTSSIFKKFQKKIVRGTANPHMGHENFNLTPFALPKLSEQKIIVKKLDSLSEQTKKLEGVYRQKLADLEELKKSILNKAFKGEL